MNIYLDNSESLPVAENRGSLLKRLFRLLSPDSGPDIAATGDDDECRAVFKSLDDARSEWLEAARNFDQVSEHDIVDYYIYRIKASQTRYEYFLRKAKELRLRHKRA